MLTARGGRRRPQGWPSCSSRGERRHVGHPSFFASCRFFVISSRAPRGGDLVRLVRPAAGSAEGWEGTLVGWEKADAMVAIVDFGDGQELDLLRVPADALEKVEHDHEQPVS